MMVKLSLNIAQVAIVIYIEDLLAYIVPHLEKIFSGFLYHRTDQDAVLTISYESLTYQESRFEPVILSQENNLENKEIFNALEKHYPLLKDALVVGFLNGCLAYNRGSQRAHLALFQAENTSSHIVSMHKLLFVFMCTLMAERNKLILHGAGIKNGQDGYLFLGESGAGKSTIASFVQKEEVLSDDSPIIAQREDGFYMCASPYSQVNMFDTKKSDYYKKETQLKTLYFLNKADQLYQRPRKKRSALGEIIARHIHAFEFMDKKSKYAAFNICYDLCNTIPGYDLYFQKNNKFWQCVAE